MTGAEALQHLAAAGVPVRLAEDGTLRLPRQAAALHPDLLAELRTHRDEAVELLRDRLAPAPPPAGPGPLHPCVRCHAETGDPSSLVCPKCWRDHQEGGRILRFDPDRSPATPPACRHELVTWHPGRRRVECSSCGARMIRKGGRFVALEPHPAPAEAAPGPPDPAGGAA